MRVGGRTMVFPIGDNDVGRLADCWLILDDDLISRTHARFHVSDDKLEIEDLGSRNGTFVNGEQVYQRTELRDGDKVRIGNEVIAILASDGDEGDDLLLRRTIGPGDGPQFPSLIGQLVEKSLAMGKIKEAERYALALTNQLTATKVPVQHPTARSCIRCLISLADRTSSGIWIDRVFRLHTVHEWLMPDEVLDAVFVALNRIPRVPGTALQEYEQVLRHCGKEGVEVPSTLMSAIAELADAYGKN